MNRAPYKAGVAALPAFTLLFIAACAGGNDPCFSPASLVTDKRVLAVRADPPETVYDPSGVDPIEPINLAALIVDGVAGSDGEYGRAAQITALRTIIHVCAPPSVADVNAQPGCGAGGLLVADMPYVPDVDTPFVFYPSPYLLQEALDADPVHGLAGLQLRAQFDFSVGNTKLTAMKTLNFQLKGSKATLNHGLTLIGMETSNQGVHKSYVPGESVDLVVTQSSGLRPLIAPGPGGTSAIETYLAYDNSGQLTQFEEHITYAFYAGNSLFFGQSNAGAAIYNGAAGDVADEPEPGTPDPPDGLVNTEPVYPGDQGATFWVIARDDRGAVTWQEVPYFAREMRSQCQRNGNGSFGKCPVALYGCN